MNFDTKKSQLRFFITIYYTNIANEILYSNGDYFKSLMFEVSSFEKNISEDKIKKMFFVIQDPFDFAMAITKELD